MTDGYEDILYAVQDGIALITLNRPERLNAWTAPMQRSIKRAVVAAARDDSVRVIVITGAGRGFCAGADMNLLKSASGARPDAILPAPEQWDEPSEAAPTIELDPELSTPYPGRFGYLLSLQKPVIAAINGPCVGIGLAFTLFCDLRFASDQAFFTTAFAARGLIAEHGLSWLLPRLVGPARALDLLFSARRVTASEAATMGLVNDVFAHDTFMADVGAYAQRLTQAVSPRSLAVIKAQVLKGMSQELEVALAIADREMAKSFACEDFKEGVAHFTEKRAPRFRGR
jgi:enoyl-CoA hydratase/carnithine racemase